ncbi:hypothetical protein SUGI_0475630 [Cryptomeria japonica]|nr:hypothetical protein SUGI_0475630 [Cryptomeria japonica]
MFANCNSRRVALLLREHGWILVHPSRGGVLVKTLKPKNTHMPPDPQALHLGVAYLKIPQAQEHSFVSCAMTMVVSWFTPSLSLPWRRTILLDQA